MSRTATVVWSTILGGSLVAISAGFLGGRTVGERALTIPEPPQVGRGAPPAPIQPIRMSRALHGAGSFDAGDDDPDAYGDPDAAVAARPAGWVRAGAEPPSPRIAVLVVDADRDASALGAFLAEPFPLAVLVAPDDSSGMLRAVHEAGKTALAGCRRADVVAIAAMRSDGADGIMCSTDDATRARALVDADTGGVVIDDLETDDDALYRAARAAHAPALTRDVVVDARDDTAYVDFMFAQALAIARRSGAATVALHARPSSLRALERFARRAERDGADMVDVRELAS